MKKYRQQAAGALLAVVLYLTLSGYLFDFIFFASFAFLGLTAAVLVLRIMLESGIDADDVYGALSPIVWKTAAEIEKEIKATKGLPNELDLGDAIAETLDKLERRNFVERRNRTWDTLQSSSNDGEEPEFRRKAGGNAPRKKPLHELARFAPQPT